MTCDKLKGATLFRTLKLKGVLFSQMTSEVPRSFVFLLTLSKSSDVLLCSFWHFQSPVMFRPCVRVLADSAVFLVEPMTFNRVVVGSIPWTE